MPRDIQLPKSTHHPVADVFALADGNIVLLYDDYETHEISIEEFLRAIATIPGVHIHMNIFLIMRAIKEALKED